MAPGLFRALSVKDLRIECASSNSVEIRQTLYPTCDPKKALKRAPLQAPFRENCSPVLSFFYAVKIR